MVREKYLKIDPSGDLSWIELKRRPLHDDIHRGAESISLADLYPIIGCDCVELVHTLISDVVIMVDESGKIKEPMQPLNPLASKLYYGSNYGDMIHGPAVVFALRRTGPYQELDIFPLSVEQLDLVTLCLGCWLPER